MDKSAVADARKRTWHRIAALFKIAVSLGLLWILFTTYDVRESIERLAGLDPWWLVLASGLFLALIILGAVRWRIIITALGESLPLGPALGILVIGSFFNQVLPSNLGGDAMRIWRLYRRGSALGRAVGSVMIDRVVALAGLSLLVLSTLPLAADQIGNNVLLVALWIFLAVVPVGLAILLWLDQALILFSRILPGRVIDSLGGLARDARAVLLNRRYGVVVLVCALANQVLLVMVVLALARGLGLPAAFWDFIVLIPPVILASVIPLSFAGWGVREAVMVAMLGTIGISAGDALALSVLFGLFVLAASLPGGVIWLITGNRLRSESG